jgi:peptidoglycan hydrolase CwlO-like protein
VVLSVRIKKILVCSLAAVFSLGLFYTSMVVGQAEPPSGIKDKLNSVSEKEKKTLQSLFTLSQEITVMDQEEQRLKEEIKSTNNEIKALETSIAEEEASYALRQEGLKQVLRSYQRMGPGSYLEIILNSDSLTTFLRRVNTLRDITRNTGVLLDKLQQSKDKLTAEKSKLSKQLALVEERERQSKEELDNKLKLKGELEGLLASLKGEKQYYQEQLMNLEKTLEELKPVLSDAVKEFYNIVQTGNAPKDAFKISFSLFSIKGTIDDKAFNEIISTQPNLSQMKFAFHQDRVDISMPDRNLIITGNFVIADNNVLRFQAEGGSFYGMPLEKEFIVGLFNGNEMALDLKPLLGKNTLQSITNHEGYLELSVKPNLF